MWEELKPLGRKAQERHFGIVLIVLLWLHSIKSKNYDSSISNISKFFQLAIFIKQFSSFLLYLRSVITCICLFYYSLCLFWGEDCSVFSFPQQSNLFIILKYNIPTYVTWNCPYCIINHFQLGLWALRMLLITSFTSHIFW